MEKEMITATMYRMGFKDFKEDESHHWATVIWELFNVMNGYSHNILDMGVGQYGRDENGFYENYVWVIICPESRRDWDKYFSNLGYGFVKEEIKVLLLYKTFEDDPDEEAEHCILM